MKTENNLQNKAAFFAQYWGQMVLMKTGWGSGTMCVDKHSMQYDQDGMYLKLSNLAQISDEDAQWLAEIEGDSDYPESEKLFRGRWLAENINSVHCNLPHIDIVFAIDGLRARGYLVQWMDLMPADLIEYGWIKIKDHEDKNH